MENYNPDDVISKVINTIMINNWVGKNENKYNLKWHYDNFEHEMTNNWAFQN